MHCSKYTDGIVQRSITSIGMLEVPQETLLLVEWCIFRGPWLSPLQTGRQSHHFALLPPAPVRLHNAAQTNR